MAEPEKVKVHRTWEQPDSAISFYSDHAQIAGTGNEVIVQLYETLFGPPGASGKVETARTRLRASVVLSKAHAATIGRLLTESAEKTPEERKDG